MIIIPIENKVDWKNPPIATIALILINVLVFVLYQSYDDSRFDKAFTYYEDAELLQREAPLYRDYLEASSDVEKRELYREFGVSSLADIPDEGLMYPIFYDRDFDGYLADQIPATDYDWQRQRQQFETLRGKISFYDYGLTPAEPFSITQITAQFLHGGFDHLFGNMLFLFLFGFALEIALGRTAFIGIYLLSGVAANLLYIAFNWNSLGTLVGASGAISGLMGMYIAVYGLRKITFFYTVIFYADYFRAPALIVFPVWVLKELYGVWFEDTNVAYWAHIGGLLAGFAAVFVLKDRLLKIDWQYVDKIDEDAPMREDLGKVDEAMAQMNFDRAKQLCQRLQTKYPDRIEIRKKQFDVWKLEPTSKAFHLAAFELFKLAPANQRDAKTLAIIADTLKVYTTLTPKTPALNEKLCLALAPVFIRAENFDAANQLVEQLVKLESKAPQFPQIVFNLSNLLEKRNQKPLAQRYRKFLQVNFPASDAAELVAKHR